MTAVSLACAILIVLLGTRRAEAEIEWAPEGQFHVRMAATVGGPERTGRDSNFELLSGQLGTKILISPGFFFRGVGELLTEDPSRRPGDLRLGFVDWTVEPIGRLRLGQIPTPWIETEERLTRDLVLGRGISASDRFYLPSGLGASWTKVSASEWATGSLGLAATYTEGLLLSTGLAENPVFLGTLGTGPAIHATATWDLSTNWATHVFGRYGLLQDQQVGAAISGTQWRISWFGEAVASASNPPGEPIATDLGAQIRASFPLSEVHVTLWREELVGRMQAIGRNIGGAVRRHSALAAPPRRTDIVSSMALVHRITDSASVAVDAINTWTMGTQTPQWEVSARAGMQF